MPKRSKLPPMPDYVGGGENPEKLLIQKSNPLLSLSETDMTLPELKILDAYLSRINSHEPEKRYVRLEKGELERLLGVTRILQKDLEKRIDNLFQTLTIRDETKTRGFTKIALFVKAECLQDDDGLWQVNLACSEEAMEYIFNIENIGYLKYRLKSVVNLTSRYSYVLYLLLEDYCYQENFEVPLDELKALLNCKGESYEKFKVFNDRILKICHKEINEKTDISYSYTTIKKGRNVVAIRFDIERKPRIENTCTALEQKTQELPMPSRPPLPPVRTVAIKDNKRIVDLKERLEFAAENEIFFNQICEDNTLKFFAGACGYEFLPQEMKSICDLLYTINVPCVELPERMGIQPEERRDYERLYFLDNLYSKFYSYAQWKSMSREQRFNYFYKMLQNVQPES